MKFSTCTPELLEYIKQNYRYDPHTGLLWIKLSKYSRVVGRSKSNSKHLQVGILGKMYSVHRIAWLLSYDSFPSCEIDHIDRNPTNNKLTNLREASHQENKFNRTKYSTNTSGFKGVVWVKDKKKWRAGICLNSKFIFIGYFSSPEEASKAYEVKASELFGKFSPH